MTPLALTITQGGIDRFAQAQGDGDVDLTISAIGVTSAIFVVSPTLTDLPGEIKRISTVAGELASDDIIHLTMRDDAEDAYALCGFGLFLADGTLFAVYGQADAIMEKSPATTLLLALDLKFPSVDITSLTFGDTNFLDPPATETTKGVARLATSDDVDAGDAETIVTPAQLLRKLAALSGSTFARLIKTTGLATGGGDLTDDRTINVTAASNADGIAGTATDRAMTPASNKATLDDRLGAGAPTSWIKTLLAAVSAAGARSTLELGNAATLSTATSADLLAATAGSLLLTPAAFGGLDHLFAADTGRYVFPGGLIFQWFLGTAIGNSTSNIPIPQPYKTACVAAWVQGASTDTDAKDNNPSVNGALHVNTVPVFSATDASISVRCYTFGY